MVLKHGNVMHESSVIYIEIVILATRDPVHNYATQVARFAKRASGLCGHLLWHALVGSNSSRPTGTTSAKAVKMFN